MPEMTQHTISIDLDRVIGPIDRNDTANRLFHCLRTVILTKAACIFGTGNPSTQFWQPDGASGVMIQVGDTEDSIPGIWDMRNIRFQSEIGEVDSVGVKLVNVAEPNFRQCEFNNFGKAGLEFSNPINIWTGVYDSWFVTPEGGTGILFNGTAITDSEADITLCKFGGLGDGITIDGLYQNIDINSCRFRYDGGTLNRAIRVIKGIGIGITNPRFIAWPETRRPILFTDRAASTNLNSFVSLAHGSYSGSTNYVEIGANVLGVVVTNNIIRGAIRPHDQ